MTESKNSLFAALIQPPIEFVTQQAKEIGDPNQCPPQIIAIHCRVAHHTKGSKPERFLCKPQIFLHSGAWLEFSFEISLWKDRPYLQPCSAIFNNANTFERYQYVQQDIVSETILIVSNSSTYERINISFHLVRKINRDLALVGLKWLIDCNILSLWLRTFWDQHKRNF